MFSLNRAITVAAIAVGTISFAVPTAHAQTMPPPVPSIKFAGAAGGVVVDSSSGTVAGALVMLLNDEGIVVRKGLTGEKGMIGFQPLKPGLYTVVAGKKGAGNGQAKIFVKPQEVAKFKVELAQ